MFSSKVLAIMVEAVPKIVSGKVTDLIDPANDFRDWPADFKPADNLEELTPILTINCFVAIGYRV
tara:strand:- start:6008 stop:6202 length:195 start_codon:yes stop_codon:yes gene_type:complete